MFMEKQGTGHATGAEGFERGGGYLYTGIEYTETDWKWFEENTENAVKSLEILERRKH
jgi:hypothetical protein